VVAEAADIAAVEEAAADIAAVAVAAVGDKQTIN
jgi:hypothetical protein